MVRCADEHSPIYLRAVLCLEPLARTVAPFFLLLQLSVLGDGLLLRRLCVCVCVWLWLALLLCWWCLPPVFLSRWSETFRAVW